MSNELSDMIDFGAKVECEHAMPEQPIRLNLSNDTFQNESEKQNALLRSRVPQVRSSHHRTRGIGGWLISKASASGMNRCVQFSIHPG
jgi:hypothetical protein